MSSVEKSSSIAKVDPIEKRRKIGEVSVTMAIWIKEKDAHHVQSRRNERVGHILAGYPWPRFSIFTFQGSLAVLYFRECSTDLIFMGGPRMGLGTLAVL